MEALSLDLRERVLAACDEGDLTRQEVAEDFVVSRSFVQKLLRRRADGAPLGPRPRSGGAAPLLAEAELGRLRELVREKPDRTLAELRSALHESGGPRVSVPTVCRAMKKLGLPLKKRRYTPASGTRRGYGGCADSGWRGRGGCRRRGWFLWTKAARTRP
jgi:transposase